jgi:cytoskeletal protein CcmA (bactofilin family)
METLIGGEMYTPAKRKERDMFGKSKDNPTETRSSPFTCAAVTPLPSRGLEVSSIGSSITIVGKISGKGTVRISGRIEGELHASTVLIDDGAQVEGDIVAEELTIGGRVKGTIHANRVKLIGSAIVEGDIFHRSLSIDENARFEGSSRREETAMEEVGGKISLLEDFSVSASAPAGARNFESAPTPASGRRSASAKGV